MKSTSTFLISLLLFKCCFSQDINFKTIDLPKDEQQVLITGICQDSLGFIWLATWGGLFRYDGTKFTVLHYEQQNPRSLAIDRTECILANDDGYVYVGTYGRGLDRLDPRTSTFTHFQHHKGVANSISSDTVTAIEKDRNGRLWVGTSTGLNLFDAATGTFRRFLHADNDTATISENHIRVIYRDHKGTLWIGTKGPFRENGPSQIGGLNRYNADKGTFTRFLHDPANPHSISNNTVTSIFEDSRGVFYVGTAGDGLHIMDRATGSFQQLAYDPQHPDHLSRPPVLNKYPNESVDHITFITEDHERNLWIGTFQNGINVYNAGKQQVVHYGAGEKNINKLANSEFWKAFVSKEGILWVSSWGVNDETLKFYEINPHQFTFPATDVGAQVVSVAESHDRSLWFNAYTGELLKQQPNGTIQVFKNKNLRTSDPERNYTRVMVEAGDSGFWQATYQGLQYFNKATNSFTAYNHQSGNPSSLVNDSVISIARGSAHDIWIGTESGLDRMNTDTKIFTHFLHNDKDSNSLRSDRVISLLYAKNGDLWVGSTNSIDRFNPNTGIFKHYTNQLTDIAFCIFEDAVGQLWIGTSGGLFHYNAATDNFTRFSDDSRQLSNITVIFNIAEDRHNNLLLSTPSSLIQLNKNTSQVTVFGKINGLTGNIYRLVITRQNGDVIILDNNRYLTYRPGQSFTNLPTPYVVIEKFFIGDEPVNTGPVLSHPIYDTREIRLSHNQNIFSFSYGVIDYSAKDGAPPSFYKLENYDSKWRASNGEYNAGYINVPPGNYTFRLRATNNSGLWTERAISIIIRPPWWKTVWAYIAYAVLFIVFSVIANRLIRARIIEKERMKTKDRELAHAKEIERAYNELKVTQAQLIQSEKMASLGELTAGIAHEIQNPLNFVNNFSEVNNELIEELRRDDGKSKAEKGKGELESQLLQDIFDNNEKIIQHGKRADAIVKNMLEHSKQSAGERQPTDINALADEYLKLAYHGTRARDKSFNAALHTDFDPGVGTINLIPQDIGRVLLNLYNNAFYAVKEKAVNEGLHSPGGYQPQVSVSTKKAGNNVMITVKDNGNGIPQPIVDKIFQPFFTTKPTGQGTGLGLSLAYDIIKAHGGEIKVHSNEGSGTEFVILLQANSI